MPKRTVLDPQGQTIQHALSGLGYNSGDPAIERIYPWYGFRVGVIGTP